MAAWSPYYLQQAWLQAHKSGVEVPAYASVALLTVRTLSSTPNTEPASERSQQQQACRPASRKPAQPARAAARQQLPLRRSQRPSFSARPSCAVPRLWNAGRAQLLPRCSTGSLCLRAGIPRDTSSLELRARSEQLTLLLARLVSVGCYSVEAWQQIQNRFDELSHSSGFGREMAAQLHTSFQMGLISSRILVSPARCRAALTGARSCG